MTRVQDMATITPVGLKRAAGTDVASRAYMVWLSARNDGNKTRASDKAEKLLYSGTFKRIVLDLYPELSPMYLSDELEQTCKEVYAYLRTTGNAVCISRGNSRGSGVVWEIASKWIEPDGPVVLKVSVGHSKPTKAENKLTPHEAGEDRQPMPVSVTTAATHDTKDTVMTATAVEVPSALDKWRKEKREQRDENIALCEMSISNAVEPVTVAEIAHDVGLHETTVRGALADLVKTGKMYHRTETREERAIRFAGPQTALRSELYSTQNPVPARTQRVVVSGYKAELRRDPAKVQKRGVNDALMLSAARTGVWESIGVIGRRAGVPSGSRTGVMARLVEQGVIIAKKKSGTTHSVTVYRKRSGATNGTGIQVVEAPAAPPLKTETLPSTARERAIAAVDQLIAELTGSAELEVQLAAANERIAELEHQLAVIRSALGQG